jgi:3-phosphoshikimate 1-carboxyvinyltransferase
MDISLSLPNPLTPAHLTITGSKSETNRLLLLRALYPRIIIQNASESDDSEVMRRALGSTDNIIDVHHAGTAMRFLTSYFAIQPGREVIMTGSQRMQERPIGILVDALRALDADITYTDKEGFPPLKIKGKKLTGGRISIEASVSSQYITAILLIAPRLENGLELVLEGEITSRPYIEMTLGLLKDAGFEFSFTDNTITVFPKYEIYNLKSEMTVESDWSSASYFYSIVALSEEGTKVTLSSYKQDSLQGDSAIAAIYKGFGVHTEFSGNSVILSKIKCQPVTVYLDLNNTPDIAQTIAVTCLGLSIECTLTGLHTLKIKETDRLGALKTEFEKFGAQVDITPDSITMCPLEKLKNNIIIDTYNDHRMAMAFAPLAAKGINLTIKDAGVVSKSYPAFWEDLRRLGFEINEL